jgi:flagellar basal-body rod modification protein FlgD
MNISALTATNNTAATTSTGSASASDPTAQRDLFMTLLVAQLKNQDPLSPQDGTAFVAQLAQFNSLDQLVGIRDSIDKLSTLLTPPKTSTTTNSITG